MKKFILSAALLSLASACSSTTEVSDTSVAPEECCASEAAECSSEKAAECSGEEVSECSTEKAAECTGEGEAKVCPVTGKTLEG